MLRQAVYMEDTVTLEHLAKQKVDLEYRDEMGSTPLHVASTQCKPDTVQWLLRHRANVAAIDSEGFSALTWACIKGHKEVLTLLIAGKADVEEITGSSGKTPLSLAAERGHFDCVEELLAKKASMQKANIDGSNALMCASHRGETEVVLHLLGKNSLANQNDSEGWTPLIYALNNTVASRSQGGENVEKKVALDGILGRRTAVEILLLHRADVNARTADGLSPLIVACGHDRPQGVRRILEARAEVNAAAAKGQTALLMAAVHNLPDVARALIMANAEVNATNAKHDSPLSLSEKHGFKDLVDLLKKAGAVAPKAKKKGKKK